MERTRGIAARVYAQVYTRAILSLTSLTLLALLLEAGRKWR